MAVNRRQVTQEQKKAEAERLWLAYFNETLFKQGLITEQERNKLQNSIIMRRGGFQGEHRL